MVSLVLGDDHTIFVDTLSAALVRRGFTVLGTAASLPAALAEVRRTGPQVCLLDRWFPEDGELGEVLADITSQTRVVMLSVDNDPDTTRAALDAGIRGYVNKTCGLSALVAVIHRVLDGEIVVDVPEPRRPQPPVDPDASRLAAQLTERERECLRLLVAGGRTSTMAHALGVAPTTVRTHVQAILTKLGVHSRLEAAAFAVRHGVVPNAEPVRARSSK